MRFSSSRHHRLLFAITVSAALMNAAPAAASGSGGLFASAPKGFEALTAERIVVLDAFYGGVRRGQVQARIAPGSLQFDDPAGVAALIPDVERQADLIASLAGILPSNPSLACGATRPEGCGILTPERAGIILDEDRFRVDLFVAPDLLSRPDPSAAIYLPASESEPSFVSQFGATVSGSTRGDEAWHLQNRSIVSLGHLRLRSDSSLSTGYGLSFDKLTLEADRGDWRYAGGIFWAPGSELVGRRKIVGLGVATQLDTQLNKEALQGTPLSIFLQQPAKVELLVDGRLVSSRIYSPGNRLVDTESLPNGSYDVILRIQEDGRPARDERRLFTKGSAMAPLGRPQFSVFAGFLPSSNRGVGIDIGTIYYQAAAAYRLSPELGIDATLVGTRRKAILESGATYHSKRAQLRAAALLSSSADYGALVRLSSVGRGPISVSLDLRKVVSSDGRPLIPVTTSRGTFSEDPDSPFSDRGSYTQALSILGYRLGNANLRLIGTYRKNRSEDATYSIGAAAELPIVRTARWDIVLQADARQSDRDFASFIGARFLFNRGGLSFSGSGGARRQSDGSRARNHLVGEVQAGWNGALSDHGQLAADVAIGRDIDGSYARASANARSDAVNARADLLHQFGGNETTQYAASLNGGFAAGASGLHFGGRDLNDTAILVSTTGGEHGRRFEVLVDEVARATIGSGGQKLIFLRPYEMYDVRLRPVGGQIAGFDSSARAVTLYPGNVSRLDWEITPLFILFGRAVDAQGTPLADADLSGLHGIGRTDGQGYFQIEASSKDELRMSGHQAAACTISIPSAQPVDGLVSAGDMMCR